MLLKQRDFGDVAGEDVVCGQVAAVEGEEQVAEPRVGCVDERIEDRVEKELSKVVDGVGDEGSDAEVVGTRLALAELELADVDTREIEEGVFVICRELVLGLQKSAKCMVRYGGV